MALVESLLTAIVRADGDALVMHVGEKPYVVASAGPIELSTQGLNLQAMAGMTAQLLPADAQRALAEFGAVEHELSPLPEMHGDRFTVVVARGGDDVWIEVRRHRRSPAGVAADVADAPPGVASAPTPDPVTVAPVPEAAAVSAPEPMAAAPVSDPDPEPVAAAAVSDPEPVPGAAEPPAAAPPVALPAPIPASAHSPAPESWTAPAPWTAPTTVTAATPTPEPEAPSFADATPSHVLQPAASIVTPTQVEPEPTPLVEAMGEIAFEKPAPVVVATPAAVAPAPVIPLTRTLRIEVPPPATARPADASDIQRLLALAAARGATALYLTTHASPYMRVDADVRVLEGEPPLSADEVQSAVLELLPEESRDGFRRGDPTEWVSELGDIGPIRCSTFRDHRGPGAIFQLISMRPTAAEQLGIPPEIQALASESEGLVIVAAPRANGKTTLVGSLVDLINRERPAYVITLERQIQVVHEPHGALISQREVRGTKDELLAIARSALRENPDVIVIEDLSSAEMLQFALDATTSGVLVIASVTTSSTTAALTRLLELVPADMRPAVESLMGERLRGAVAQVLLRRVGGGRVAAREVLLATPAVASAVASGQTADLPKVIESGRKHGQVSLTDSLVALLRAGTIDLREAYRKADDRDAFVAALKRENLETALLERLA